MTPNSPATQALAVGAAAPPVDVAVVALAAMTLLKMLNSSETCCSLKALAPLGRAVYQSGAE